jgi:hypothetical protein
MYGSFGAMQSTLTFVMMNVEPDQDDPIFRAGEPESALSARM